MLVRSIQVTVDHCRDGGNEMLELRHVKSTELIVENLVAISDAGRDDSKWRSV